jgi:alkylation response protein AidB-like acyl-CoA dehydrogenase
MDLALTDEQLLLQRTVRDSVGALCTKAWLDGVEAREEFPFDLYERMAGLGLFGIGVPEHEGGVGGGLLEIALVCEELGRYGGSVIMTYIPTGVFGVQSVLASAAPELRARVLPDMAAGRLRTAFALTEPDAGSDAAAVRTRAVLRGDHWVVNGSKIFSSGAHVADFLVLTARTGTPEQRGGGLTLFLADARAQGLTIKGIPKLGHHAVQTCEIGISDVRVPTDRVLGEVDGGWAALLDVLDAERIATAAVCVGLAQRCIEMALAHGLARHQFGQPIAAFQAISHMLAEMQTETAAARWLTRDAAWRKDHGLPCSMEASMAKAYATECGTRTAARGMQILGGYGYTKEYEMERFYREAKLYEIAGGSTQIQRNIIARHMGIPDVSRSRRPDRDLVAARGS